jgi:hypothetical protein
MPHASLRAAKCCVALAIMWPAILAADDRFVVPADLHGRAARFALDTAAGVEFAIWHPTAARFGLTITSPTTTAGDGQVALGWTEPTQLRVLGQNLANTSLAVVDTPNTITPDVDGLIGWPALRNNILVLQVAERHAQIVPRVPAAALQWQHLGVRTDAATLILTLPSRDDGTVCSVLVDTGAADGVRLPPEKWRQWRAAHSVRASTMTAYYKPGAGLVVAEESWASELTIGNLLVHDVPVMEADITDCTAVGEGYAASLGLAAMSRLELVVDGAHGVAYARPSPSAPPKYAHNRLGAVFVPRDARSDDLVASVADHSPAAAAGLRPGDVLLKIDRLDVTQFRTQPGILPLSRFWCQPAATKLNLELRRGAEIFRTTVELRDLLGADHVHEGVQQ